MNASPACVASTCPVSDTTSTTASMKSATKSQCLPCGMRIEVGVLALPELANKRLQLTAARLVAMRSWSAVGRRIVLAAVAANGTW